MSREPGAVAHPEPGGAGAGNIAAGQVWPRLAPGALIAVLPVQNMSGAKVPDKVIRARLENMVRRQGLDLVSDEVLDDFIVRHRLRNTAGVNGRIAEALRKETGAEGVLSSALELYGGGSVPRISLTAWLDSCGAQPRILWMDGTSLSGDESPGLLDLSLVPDMEHLLDKALPSLFASWGPTFAHEAADYWEKRRLELGGERFSPRTYYRSGSFVPGRPYTVAVIPFSNLSERKYAGELMELQFVRLLHQWPNLTVIEPGELRQYLLQYRITMEEGLSLANAEVLFAKLGVDLVVTGKIFDYDDYVGSVGKPIVDFSVEVFGRDGNKTLWASKSTADGEQGVYFFDFGKVYTAHTLAERMVGAIGRMLEQ